MLVNSNFSVSNQNVFKGMPKNNEALRNRCRVLLSMDMLSQNPVVKMPDNPLEKDVLLEALTHRLNLDNFVRLVHKRSELISNGANKSEIKQINDKIDEQKEMYTESFDYFKRTNDLEQQCLSSSDKNIRISEEQELKFWHKSLKNNIN